MENLMQDEIVSVPGIFYDVIERCKEAGLEVTDIVNLDLLNVKHTKEQAGTKIRFADSIDSSNVLFKCSACIRV